MEINSRYCELSTYAASSGYNSSTASSSLNYIDVDNLSVIDNNQCDLIVDKNNNNNNKTPAQLSGDNREIEQEEEEEEDFKPITRVIITITLVKKEQVQSLSQTLIILFKVLRGISKIIIN